MSGRVVEFRPGRSTSLVKAWPPAGQITVPGEVMQYLVAIHHPDDYDPAIAEDEAMGRDIDALNEEMVAAGVRVYANGLQPVSRAKSLRAQPGGKVLVTDGPY